MFPTLPTSVNHSNCFFLPIVMWDWIIHNSHNGSVSWRCIGVTMVVGNLAMRWFPPWEVRWHGSHADAQLSPHSCTGSKWPLLPAPLGWTIKVITALTATTHSWPQPITLPPQPTIHWHSLPHTAPWHITNTTTSHQLLNRWRTGNWAAGDWCPSVLPPLGQPGLVTLSCPPLSIKQHFTKQIPKSTTGTGGHQHLWQDEYVHYWYMKKLTVVGMRQIWGWDSMIKPMHNVIEDGKRV